MKSEKAKEILSASSITDSCGYEYLLMSCAEKAVEAAEQEAEKRMRGKAIEAHRKVCFFRNPKDNTCANTATPCGEHSCYYMNYLIQELNEA